MEPTRESLHWRIQKKEAQIEDLRAQYAEAVQRFGNPHTNIKSRSVRITHELEKARKEIVEQMATLRSLLLLRAGFRVKTML